MTNIKEINKNKTVITDKNDISNNFNEYFVDVGYNLNCKFDCFDDSECIKYIDMNDKSMFFKLVTSSGIEDIVKKIKNYTSAGYDDVDVKIVKDVFLKQSFMYNI